MASDRAKIIIQRAVDKFSQFDGVATLVLTGSQVEGNKFPHDQFSDIELYVVAFDKSIGRVEKEVQKISFLPLQFALADRLMNLSKR